MSVRPHSSGGCRCGSLALAAIMVAALIAFFLPVPVASAESPFRVGSQIEDRASVLGDRTGEVEAAMKELQKNASLQLWMVYVDTFSGTSATDWAGQTAEKSDLGLRDILIAVAVEDRAYAYSVDQDFPLTDAELNDVMTTSVEPALTEDDWAGAAVGAAAGLEQASSGVPVAPAGQPTGSESSGGSYLVVWVVVLAILAFIGFFVVRGLRRASRARGTPAASSGGPGADRSTGSPAPGRPAQAGQPSARRDRRCHQDERGGAGLRHRRIRRGGRRAVREGAGRGSSRPEQGVRAAQRTGRRD